MTLVINQLSYQQSLNDEQPSETVNDDTTKVPPPKFIMFLWDYCIDSNDQQIEEIFVENTQVVKDSPRDTICIEKVQFPTPPLPKML
jgi:hypothetical protein